MRLVDLNPKFVSGASPGGWNHVDALVDAQGIMFLCPACYERNGGAAGTHMVLAWFRGRGVPDDMRPGPGRWEVSGTSFADMTLSPSIQIDCWHGFVRGGEVR